VVVTLFRQIAIFAHALNWIVNDVLAECSSLKKVTKEVKTARQSH